MPVPLHQAKAEFFRMLGHPVRIRVLELLQAGLTPVRELLTEIDIEPSNLSQQLAVLRRSGIVTATREGSTVVYHLAGGDVAELMTAARRILTELWRSAELVTTSAVTTPAVMTPTVTTSAATRPAATRPAATASAVTTPAVTTPAVTTPAPPDR